MTVHFITGNLGGGKTLISVSRAIDEYLRRGKQVCTNLDLFFDKYPDNYTSSKPYCIRIPDHPTSSDLKALGYGNTSANEEKNGLLIFDECGTWFNSHEWNAPDRKEFIDVLIHLRKYGWDCIFIVQDFEMIDKQARNAIAEYLVTCSRTDRINIPVVSFITKLLTGKPFPLPRMHVGKVMYGKGTQRVLADTWRYRGTELFDFYDTKQIFSPSYSDGIYCYLKPSNYHYDEATKLKAKKDYNLRAIKRLWHIRPPVLFFFIIGIVTSVLFSGLFSMFNSEVDENRADVKGEHSTPVSPDSTESEIDRPIPLAEQIRLSGIFVIGDIRKYFFRLNGLPYEPATDGFAYMPFGKCGAILIKDDFKSNLVCSSDDEI